MEASFGLWGKKSQFVNVAISVTSQVMEYSVALINRIVINRVVILLHFLSHSGKLCLNRSQYLIL